MLYIILIVFDAFWWRHVQFCFVFDSLKFKMRSIVFFLRSPCVQNALVCRYCFSFFSLSLARFHAKIFKLLNMHLSLPFWNFVFPFLHFQIFEFALLCVFRNFTVRNSQRSPFLDNKQLCSWCCCCIVKEVFELNYVNRHRLLRRTHFS